MKEQRRADAAERDAAYAKLSLPEKFARALNAPGKAEKELRRLYWEALWLGGSKDAKRISQDISYDDLEEVAHEYSRL